jgi:hypothetical protein
MQQLTDTLTNFSRVQMETNCAHARNRRMWEVGWRPGYGGAWLASVTPLVLLLLKLEHGIINIGIAYV